MPTKKRFRLAIKVTTEAGRVLPPRTIVVVAETPEEAESIARGVCKILERNGERKALCAIEVSGEGDLTLEEAVILAATGKWGDGL